MSGFASHFRKVQNTWLVTKFALKWSIWYIILYYLTNIFKDNKNHFSHPQDLGKICFEVKTSKFKNVQISWMQSTILACLEYCCPGAPTLPAKCFPLTYDLNGF